MNRNFYAVFDFETGGKNKFTSQPIEIACLILDNKLKPVKGGLFESLMRPYEDEDCEKYGLEPLQDDALKVNHRTREELREAPEPKLVWKQFADFLSNYRVEKSVWGAPVRVGYNICGFDDYFIDRLCCGQHRSPTVLEEPYNFGPSSEYGAELFKPNMFVDVLQTVNEWTALHYIPELKSVSMDNLRKYLGLTGGQTHTAAQDIIDTAEVFIRFLRMKQNFMSKGIKFKDSCKERLISIEDF